MDVALEIDDALVERVDFGNPGRQRAQVRSLDGEQLARPRVEMSLERRIDLVAPRARLAIEVGEVGERAPGDEIALEVIELPLDVGGAIGVALLMRDEPEPEPAPERLHLGHWHHLLAGAAERDDVGVIDHAVGAAPPIYCTASVKNTLQWNR